MTLKVGVDFDGNGWIELFKGANDADNLFGAKAANCWALERSTASGTVSVSESVDSMPSSDIQYYGRAGILISGFTTGEIYNIGYDGASTYNITGQASGTYTAAIWFRTAGGTRTIRLRLKSSGTAGSAIGSNTSVNDTTWTRVSVTGNALFTNQSLWLQVESQDATSASGYIYGPMIVAGSTLPDYLNCGADSRYENITRYVRSARWRTGFVAPYQYAAGAGTCVVQLNNQDKRFSPEYTSGPHYGQFVNDRLLRINDDADVLWTGYVEAWTPQFGTHTERYATINARDAVKFLQDTEIFPDLQTSVAPAVLIESVLNNVEASAKTVLTFDGARSTNENEVAIASKPYTVDLNDIETETVPYYFDQTADLGSGRGLSPRAILTDILTGIQAKLWVTRYGFVDYAGPDEDGGSVAATFDNSAMGLVYEWGQGIINACTVKAYPREAKAFGKLWRLQETPFGVDAGATEYIRAYYTDYDTGERCGAIAGTVVLDNLTYSGASIVATITDIDARSAEIQVVNSAGVSRSVNTARLRGDPLIANETISRTREDSTSIATYGRRGEEINSRWVARAKWAKRVAQFRVNRFKDARGEVLSVSGKYSKDVQFADCWIGRKIRVIDDQLEHDGNYIIIGEDHQWQPGNNHDVRLYLEPTTTTKVSTTSV